MDNSLIFMRLQKSMGFLQNSIMVFLTNAVLEDQNSVKDNSLIFIRTRYSVGCLTIFICDAVTLDENLKP